MLLYKWVSTADEVVKTAAKLVDSIDSPVYYEILVMQCRPCTYFMCTVLAVVHVSCVVVNLVSCVLF